MKSSQPLSSSSAIEQGRSLTWMAVFGVLLVSAGGCAHLQGVQPSTDGLNRQDPRQVLEQICSIGDSVFEAEGTLQMKAKSPEASGQFPASVKVVAEPRSLDLEITNPIGGTEARIRITGEKYRIDAGSGKKARRAEGNGSWGGIPLRWAVDLFLGRIPCPSNSVSKVEFDSAGRLRVETAASLSGAEEVFVYLVRPAASGEGFEAEALEWSRQGAFRAAVRVEFSGAETGTGSPTRWEAVSEQGEVKARWRSREIRKKMEKKTERAAAL